MADVADIVYDFIWSDGRKEEFKIHVNFETNQIIDGDEEHPPWTELGYGKCEHCTLKNEEHTYCPVAVHLNRIVNNFSAYKSHNEVTITVTTRERAYAKTTSLQVGLQSIFGLIMPLTGCPHLRFLKPMAHFHLPFSNLEETVSRSIAFYLLRQYIVGHHGGKPDWELKGLDEAYNLLMQVNQGLAARIGKMKDEYASGTGDASPNAIVILDSFAQMLSMEINSELESLVPIFTIAEGP